MDGCPPLRFGWSYGPAPPVSVMAVSLLAMQGLYQRARLITHETRSRNRETVSRMRQLAFKRGGKHCFEAQFEDEIQRTACHKQNLLSCYPGLIIRTGSFYQLYSVR